MTPPAGTPLGPYGILALIEVHGMGEVVDRGMRIRTETTDSRLT